MKRKIEFDWKNFHLLVHQGETIKPKGAEVNLEEKMVMYEFSIGAKNLKDKNILFPLVDTAQFNAAQGFAGALRIFCPRLIVGVNEGNPSFRPGQIRTIYRARTYGEIEDILKYLRRVPAKSKDIDGANYFFGYD